METPEPIERPYPVLAIRICQVANEKSRLQCEAWMLRKSEGNESPRAAAMVRLAAGLVKTLDGLSGLVPPEGVTVMAKKNESATVMCKVCGTNYTAGTEDARPEPLAELCPRCEALVKGTKPSAGAVKRATGSKAPKELIAELRLQWSSLQAKGIAERVIPIAKPQAKERTLNEAMGGTGKAAAKKAKAEKSEGPVGGAAKKESLKGFDKKKLSREAFRVLRLSFHVRNNERKLNRLREIGGAESNARIPKLAAKYQKETDALKTLLAQHPTWNTWADLGGATLCAGTPFTVFWASLSPILRDSLCAKEEKTPKAEKAKKTVKKTASKVAKAPVAAKIARARG